ncbi:MAG: hypothetical protein NTV23_03140 [Propionibacteriales bacterium]|nr:hypothetical protein [Propionibacteriales bacterium]
MTGRVRAVVALVAVLALTAVVVPASVARPAAVARVGGLTAAGSNTVTAKLAVKWARVVGATYQVRWASATSRLAAAKLYSSTTTLTSSPPLSNICITWYVQVRARKNGVAGPWSAAKGLRFTIPVPKVPTPITTGQTSTGQAQVRWARSPGAAGYRLHYSPAGFGNWPGYFPYTATTPSYASGINVPLPAVAPRDRFMNGAYGNPLFVQLEVKRCSGSYAKAPFVPVFAKALPPGSAATGDALTFGSYNLELNPTIADDPTKMVNLADNISDHGLDVVALQETNKKSAQDLITQLATTENQSDWAAAASGNATTMPQQIIFRTTKYTEVDSGDIGQPADGTKAVASNAARTPLPTPWVRLAPVDPDPVHQDFFVVSLHLEDRARFDTDATVVERKYDAHVAAEALLREIDLINPAGLDLPVIAAGDFQGNFGSGGPVGAGYCDEASTPACSPEGQPTFIRSGFIDSQGAVTKVGIQYGTVNKHVLDQPAANSGFGGRADFIVLREFTGASRYENVRRSYGDAGADQQSDHNLVFVNLFVPHAP